MTVTSDEICAERDRRIREGIAREIEAQLKIESEDIEIAVRDSNVTLSGRVRTRLKKSAAERAAKLVQGVLFITNDIEVTPAAQKTEPEIIHDVVDAPKHSAIVPETPFSVNVRDGLVALGGIVSSNLDRELACLVTEAVDGVQEVINLMTVRHSTKSSHNSSALSSLEPYGL